MQMEILSFEQFINEAGEQPKDAAKASAEDVSSETGSTQKVDTSKGTMKTFTINGKDYEGVLTTYQALKSKQESMGFETVGVVSIPGEKEVYELLVKKENKEENE